MKIEVRNTAGNSVGSADLDDSVFGADVNEHLLWEAVKWQLAKRRAGNASTKRYGEVRGSSKKVWKQKGTGQARQGIVYRVYVPDRGRDLTGGVGLPEAELHLADGTVLSGADACAALQVTDTILPIPFLTPQQYSALRDKPGAPVGFPALNPAAFRAFYNGQLRSKCDYSLNPAVDCFPGTPQQRSVALYPTRDNQYMYALTSRDFGKVLVLRGKLPTTPRTFHRNPIMGRGQLRYWSICQNEGLFTTAVDRFKALEFELRKRLDTTNEQLYLSGSEDVPPNFRSLIEEYSRLLSKKPGGKGGQ